MQAADRAPAWKRRGPRVSACAPRRIRIRTRKKQYRGAGSSNQEMKEGGKWQLFVPSKLAYGEQGSGPKIPPDSTLLFEVELISVQSGR